MDATTNVNLFVEILNEYLYYFDNKNTEVCWHQPPFPFPPQLTLLSLSGSRKAHQLADTAHQHQPRQHRPLGHHDQHVLPEHAQVHRVQEGVQPRICRDRASGFIKCCILYLPLSLDTLSPLPSTLHPLSISLPLPSPHSPLPSFLFPFFLTTCKIIYYWTISIFFCKTINSKMFCTSVTLFLLLIKNLTSKPSPTNFRPQNCKFVFTKIYKIFT